MSAPLTSAIDCRIRPSGFIRDLCVAVAHSWQPERIFVVLTLTAYLDESGTHDDSAVTVMGGILANARQWERFEFAFSKLKKKHHFKTFHAKKFKRRTGDFKGWSHQQQLALLNDIASVTDDGFTAGVTVRLENAEYEANYKGGNKPRRIRIESRYGLCFRQCLVFFILEGLKRVHKDRPPRLHFVLESGHRNWNEVRQIFEDEKKYLQSRDCDMLGEITFAGKDECDPLMMADFIAHFAYLIGTSGSEEPNNQGPLTQPFPFISRGESTVTHFSFKPGGLAELKMSLAERLKARRIASARGRSASREQSS